MWADATIDRSQPGVVLITAQSILQEIVCTLSCDCPIMMTSGHVPTLTAGSADDDQLRAFIVGGCNPVLGMDRLHQAEGLVLRQTGD